MALPLSSILDEVNEKVKALAEKQNLLYERIAELEKENENLRHDLDDHRQRLETALRDSEFLTMSHRLADSPDSIISARRRIARLIRTIDKCISMIKEE